MKDYVLQFGSGNPATFAGLAPTFIQFRLTTTGVTLPPPGITEIGTGVGLYWFQYGPTLSISFVADGGAAVSGDDRYIVGVLDPIQAVDEKVGTLGDSFGSTSADPQTVFGYLKRGQEFSEGNATFNKSTGAWDIYSRGSSTLLTEKTLTNTISSATKT